VRIATARFGLNVGLQALSTRSGVRIATGRKRRSQ